MLSVQAYWRRLNVYQLLDKVVAGFNFVGRIEPEKAAKKDAS